ncbi:MAG TPA: hypothetical protein VHZ81_09305 [Galbitalea sp.]|jgi:hypothetical protein|nr:hypothetical protein [Galbitalea sp.]
MVACVSLMYDTHTRGAQWDGYQATACGLCLKDDHLPAGLFADAGDATCEQCRLIAAARDLGSRPHADPKALVRRLTEEALNERLHRISPNWTASIAELMTDDDRVFVRFDVEFTDPFGVIGKPGTASKPGQAAVFRVTGNLISDVRPIVDDFGLWDESRTHWPSTDFDPHPQTHDQMETAS